MIHRVFLPFAFFVCLVSVERASAQEAVATSHSDYDTTALKVHTPLGWDLFFNLNLFGLHFDPNAATLGEEIGIGAELRVSPFFLGAIAGISDNEGMWQDDAQYYRCLSIYGGAVIGKYRLEIGGAHGWAANGDNYASVFLGGSRKYGDIFFVEPEIRIVYPVAGTFSYELNYWHYPPPFVTVSPNFSIRDIFFGLGVKLGIGYN